MRPTHYYEMQSYDQQYDYPLSGCLITGEKAGSSQDGESGKFKCDCRQYNESVACCGTPELAPSQYDGCNYSNDTSTEPDF